MTLKYSPKTILVKLFKNVYNYDTANNKYMQDKPRTNKFQCAH